MNPIDPGLCTPQEIFLCETSVKLAALVSVRHWECSVSGMSVLSDIGVFKKAPYTVT